MKLSIAVLSLAIAVGSAQAADIKVIDANAKFPEGPFVENGILYYAQYGAGEICKWDGKALTQVWAQKDSGANAVQRFGDGFIIAGYDNGTVVLTDAAGKTKLTIDKDDEGNKLLGPNDIALDKHGGAYVTLSGPWETDPIVGKIVHVAADGKIKVVAKDIHYANGLVLSADGKILYVNEFGGQPSDPVQCRRRRFVDRPEAFSAPLHTRRTSGGLPGRR